MVNRGLSRIAGGLLRRAHYILIDKPTAGSFRSCLEPNLKTLHPPARRGPSIVLYAPG